VEIGRQGDAGGLEDAADLAGDGGASGDALPSFSMVASWRRSRVAHPIRQIRPGETHQNRLKIDRKIMARRREPAALFTEPVSMKIDTYTQVVRHINGERGLLISRPVPHIQPRIGAVVLLDRFAGQGPRVHGGRWGS